MTMPASPPISPWTRHSQQWSLVASPLRPGPEDQGLYWSLVGEFVAGLKAPRGLVLGATPELALLPWPPGGHLTAVDLSADMIARVFPAAELPCAGEAVCANWKAIPLPAASVDVALGDGSLSALPSGRDYEAVVGEIHRVLRPGGRLALRCYVHPDEKEPMADVFKALDGGEIGSIHALKWRIAMALQGSLDEGVRVADIRDCFLEHIGEREAAARRLGWPLEVINTIDAYKGSTVSYTFPTLAEIRAKVAGRFAVARIVHPSYELGERCPVIGFERLP